MSTLLILASLILLPLTTYYTTTTLFHRRATSTTPSKPPPTLPYYIPGLFHALGFAQLGARAYFLKLINEYKAFAPFGVRAGFKKWVVLRDPVHVRRVLEAEGHFEDEDVFDTLYACRECPTPLELITDHDIFPVDKYVDKYVDILSASMHAKMFQLDTWTRIDHLSSFLRLVLLRCVVDTLFGTDLLRVYPALVRDYLAFAAAADNLIPGVPRMMVSGLSAPREKIYSGLKKWLESHNLEQRDEWDEKTGPGWIRDYSNGQLLQPAQLSKVAAAILSITHTTLNSLLPLTFWTLLETQRTPSLHTALTSTIAQSGNHKPNITVLSQDPLLASLTLETHRLRVQKYITLTTKTDGFPLDKSWALQRGSVVTFSTRDIGTNTTWSTQSSSTQARRKHTPLDQFDALRFLPHNTIPAPASDQDLAVLLHRFKSLSLTPCPSPAFLSALHTATLAVLLGAFEWTCDADEVDAALEGMNDGEGDVVVGVRIRVRR